MPVKTITMLELRRNTAGVLRRVARGERLVLSHRGKPVARLEPLAATEVVPVSAVEPTKTDGDDPFLSIGRRAQASPQGPIRHEDIDQLLYGDGRR